MEYQRQVLKWGAAFIVLAVALRLLSAGFFQPSMAGLLLYLDTGWALQLVPESGEEGVPPPPTEGTEEKETLTFTREDLVPIQNHTAHAPDLYSLLTQPLSWSAAEEGPTVLILHTHATETYTGEQIPYSGNYRTEDTSFNMISVGGEIARVLEASGIRVLHDQTLHDWPNYSGAYDGSRETVQRYLQKYPSIRLVLDIHRDAAGGTGELETSATVSGQRSAQLMAVVGTRSEHWQENLSLALKLSALLERESPGICRPVDLRTERFNMDLSVGSMLIEVGATGNTHGEAIIAANALAQSILELING